MSYTNKESEFKIKPIENKNDVRIVDPNPQGQIVPHEELFIYVNLVARQKSKTLIITDDKGVVNISNINKNDVNIGVPVQKIGDVFKTKPVLTTSWTEIGGFKDRNLITDFEGFGITNVDIKIQSQTAPMVVIDFIDVRGATLFEQGSCSPYGLFFSLPYPIFELTLKGYYGKAVNYYLHLVKFNTKFNSETGNMECRAEFVGYSFAFLSDTIVSYVAAAQKLPKRYRPQEILKQKYKETIDFYRFNGSLIFGDDGEPYCNQETDHCMTIWDLVVFIKNFEDKEKPKIAGSDENIELESLKVLDEKYRNYLTSLNDLVKELRNFVGESNVKETTCPELTGGYYKYEFTTEQAKELTKQDGILYNYFNRTDLNGNTQGKFLQNIKDILTTDINGKTPTDVADIKCLLSNPKQFSTTANSYPMYTSEDLKNKPWMVGVLKLPPLSYPPINNESNYNASAGFTSFLDLGYLIADAQAEYRKIAGTDPENPGILTKKRDDLIKIINSIVEQKLGFKPTIRNIFTVLLCNVDAFMEILLNVAIKAEEHHRSDGSKKLLVSDGAASSADIGIISGKQTVYSWPTVYKQKYIKDARNQGTKEIYPGTLYPDWPEVIFVEDFIKAFLEFQDDVEILNGDIEGKPGYDNFVPINALESRYWEEDGVPTPNGYLNVDGKDAKLKVIGERMIINLDHSHFNPVRLTYDAYLQPNISKSSNSNWNPLFKDDYIKQLAKIEANNFINSLSKTEEIESVVTSNFSSDVIKQLTNNGLELIDLSKTNPDGKILKFINGYRNESDPNLFTIITKDPKKYFIKTNNYYVYKNPIILKGNIEIKANPFDMDVNNLFKIIEPTDEQYKINISDKFTSKVITYKEKLIASTTSLNFATSTFKPGTDNYPGDKNFPVSWDDYTQLPSYESPQLFTTLASTFYESVEVNDWWKNGTITEDLQIGGKIVSNMAVISYWDDKSDNETDLLTFTRFDNDNNILTPNGTISDLYSPKYIEKIKYVQNNILADNAALKGPVIQAENTDPQQKTNINLISKFGSSRPDLINSAWSVATTTLITTPLWLDNNYIFRRKIDSNDSMNEDYSRRNLAYLFLNTLKPTPLITRFINNDGYLFNEVLDKDQKQSSVNWSIRAFNTNSAVAKVPKFWLLALGAQLWRWGEFVNKESDKRSEGGWNKWYRPLAPWGDGTLWSNVVINPKGEDPLCQPGWNSTFDTNNESDNYFTNLTEYNGEWLKFRNHPKTYLKKIYGDDVKYDSKFKSVFNFRQQDGKDGNDRIKGGYAINGNDDWVYFPYFNFYKSESGGEKLGIIKDYLSEINVNTLVSNYSWPILYIAPHHIPYVSSEIFDSGDKGRGSDFVLITKNWAGTQDYNTIMPETSYRSEYNEFDGSDDINDGVGIIDSPKVTHRSKSEDGNLGMVIQYLPDSVKNIIVQKFIEWTNSEWVELLNIIDPVNFNGTLTDSYAYLNPESKRSTFYEGKNSPVINAPFQPSSILGLKHNESLYKLFTDKYLVLNSTPKIWFGCGDYKNNVVNNTNLDDLLEPIKKAVITNSFYENFIFSKDQADTYLKAFLEEFNIIKNDRKKEIEQKKENEDGERELNLSILENGDDVKLSLYRTFKSITDKWISASKDGKLFFNIVKSTDGRACGRLRGLGKEFTTLAAHFQYVNRIMGDIGDYAVIDISKLSELRDNLKISLYTYISDLLTDNEYLFFSLPSYINFTGKGVEDTDLQDMFKPSLLDISEISCGPLFVCMYVGGSSRQLRFDKPGVTCSIDSELLQNIADDSFNFNDTLLPDEIANPRDHFSDGYTAFKILYGLENQNHFKSIQLDQAEFSETAESLLVIDKLSQQQGNADTSQGQNLNAAYLTRSYSCTIESMGNMMIQPMTYFDLQGVPMFSGAYLILEVSHNFKPNGCSTTFKGVRQPRTTVPIVTDAALAMDLSFKGKVKKSGRIGGIYGGGNGVFGPGGTVTKDPSQPCGYSSCVITRNGILCTLEKLASQRPYKNYNEWLDWIVKPNKRLGEPYTTVADLDKVKAGIQKIETDLKISKEEFIKFLNIESSGGDPRAGRNLKGEPPPPPADPLNCSGIIQFCQGFGGADNVYKNFSVNNVDPATGLPLRPSSKKADSISNPNQLLRDIAMQPLWRQIDYTYDFLKRNLNSYGDKALRKSDGTLLLSDIYLLVLNPGSIKISGLDTDLKIAGKQAKILYECSLGSNVTPTQNIGGNVNTNKVTCGTTSAPITLNTSSTHLLLGDSGVGVIRSTVGFDKPNKPKVDIGSNCGGVSLKFLVQSLKEEDIYQNKTYPNVQVIYTKIGTNGAYSDSQTLIKEYNDLITKIFPNAKKVVFGGTLGWGGVRNKTKADNQDPYYKKYQDLGWIYEYAACGEPCATSFSTYNNGKDISHDRTSDYFKAIIDLINKYR